MSKSDQLVRIVTVFVWTTAFVIVLFIIWDDVHSMLRDQVPVIQLFVTNTITHNLNDIDTVQSQHRNDFQHSRGHVQFKEASTVTNQIYSKSVADARERQRSRQEHVRNVCEKYYNISQLNLEENREQSVSVLENRLKWTYFNDDFRFMVSFVYKVGSSTWQQVFQSLIANSSDEFRRLQRDPLWTLASKQFLKPPSELTKRLLNFTTVIFVRHPLSRLLSAYQSKFVNVPTFWYREKAQLIIQRERGTLHPRRAHPNVTFIEFLQFITDERLGFFAQDDHWNVISDRYRPCQYYFDFIGHLETVHEDIDYLFQMLKIDGIVSYEHAKNPTYGSSKGHLKEYYSQLSDELFQKVIKKYEDDFRIFGYDIPCSVSEFCRSL